MAQQTNKADQYGLFSLFPMFLYRGKLQTHAKWKDQIFPIIKRRYEEQNGSNSYTRDTGGTASWNCDCYTSFFDESMVDHTKETEIPVGELLQDISQNIQEAIKMAEFYTHAFLVAQEWFNAYGPGQNQEAHNHVPSHLSGVYYVQYDPEKHNSTTFMNPNKMFFEGPRFNKHYYDPDLCGYGCYKEEMSLNIEEGDIVIFPSQLEHMVQRQPGITKNPNGELYCSFSFNVELVSEQEAGQRLGDQLGTDNTPTENIPTGAGGGVEGPNPGTPPESPDGNAGEWSSDWF